MIKKRIFAYTIDMFVIILIIGIMSVVLGEDKGGGHYKVYYPYSVLVLLVYPLYFILQEGMYSFTLGKKIMKIKVVNLKNEKINIVKALLRHLFDFIDIYFIGIFIIYFNKDNRRLGDYLAKTKIIAIEKKVYQMQDKHSGKL